MQNEWSPRFRYLMFIVLIAALLALLWYIKEAITPLVIALLLAYILDPIVEFFEHQARFKRQLAVALVFFSAIGLILAIPASLFPVLIAQIQDLTKNLEDILRQVQTLVATPITFMQWQIDLAPLIPNTSQLFSSGLLTVSENALTVIESVSKNALWVLVCLVTAYYTLLEWPKPWRWMLKGLPPAVQPDAGRLYAEIKRVWRGYLRGNLTLMFIVGVVFTIAWLILGVPGAIILGIIAGVLTIIPDLGPAIAAFLAVIVALFEGSTWIPVNNIWFGVIVLLTYLGLINVKNIWVRPRIFGRAVHMHDGIVFVSIIIAVVVDGILGALIVVPLLASGAILVRYIYHKVQGLSPWPEPEPEPEPAAQPEA